MHTGIGIFFDVSLAKSLMPRYAAIVAINSPRAYELLCVALDTLEQAKETEVHPHSKAFALSLLRHLGFLEQSKVLSGSELQHYIENITERKLRTPKLIRQIFVSAA